MAASDVAVLDDGGASGCCDLTRASSGYTCIAAPVDMRKQIDGLSILAKDVILQDPMSGSMFVFINARRNKFKILVWERNGFIVWYKRLERHRFHWPRGSIETRADAHRSSSSTGCSMATMCGA